MRHPPEEQWNQLANGLHERFVSILGGLDGEHEAGLIQANRMEYRIAERSPRLRNDLRAGLARVDESVRRSERALTELVTQSTDWLQLKGQSIALLSTGHIPYRFCGDLDVLSRNGEPPRGYTRHEGACHEIGAFSRPDSIPVDLHRYFPIPRIQRGHWAFRQITATELWGSVQPHPRVHGAWICNPAMTALVTLAHIRHAFLEHPIEGMRSPIRLGEVIDLLEFLGGGWVDFAEFNALITTKEFEPALAWLNEFSLVAQSDRTMVHELEVARGVLIQADLGFRDLVVPGHIIQTVSQKHGPGEILSPAQLRLDVEVTITGGIAKIVAPLHGRFHRDEIRIATASGSCRVRFNEGLLEAIGSEDLMSQISLTWMATKKGVELSFAKPSEACLVTATRFLTPIPESWQDLYDGSLESFASII